MGCMNFYSHGAEGCCKAMCLLTSAKQGNSMCRVQCVPHPFRQRPVSPCWSSIQYVAEKDIEHLIPLPLSLQSWDSRCAPLCPVSAVVSRKKQSRTFLSTKGAVGHFGCTDVNDHSPGKQVWAPQIPCSNVVTVS